MPYVYHPDGSVEWVNPGEESTYTGGGGVATESSTDTTEESSTKTATDKPEKDENRNLELEEKYLQGYTAPKEEEKVNIDKPETKSFSSGNWGGGSLPKIEGSPTWKEETAREWQEVKNFVKGTKRSVVGGLLKIPDDLTATAELGGLHRNMAQSYENEASIQLWDWIFGTKNAAKYRKDIDELVGSELESIEETGRDTLGRKPGIKPGFPGYELLSTEGKTWQKHFNPEHWGEALVQDLTSAVAFDIGITKFFKGIGLINKVDDINYLKNFYKSVGKKQYRAGLDNLAAFTVKEVVPDVFQSTSFFRPGTAPELDDKAFWVNSLPTDEMKKYAWGAIRAESDLDFSYNEEQMKEVGYGIAFLPFVHTGMMVGRKVLSKIAKGIDADTAIKQASKETAEETAEQMDETLDQTIKAQAQTKEAEVTRNIATKIDGAGKNITSGLKAGVRKLKETKATELPQIDELTKELNKIPDETENIRLLEGEIEELQRSLGVKTQKDIDKKLKEAGKNLAYYESLLEQKILEPGWKSKANKINGIIDEIENLKRLMEFESQYEEAVTSLAVKTNIETLITKKTENIRNAGIGFNNSVRDGKLLMRTVNDLVELRNKLIDIQESKLVRDPNYPDITDTGKYRQYPGALGEAQRELNELLQTIETASNSGEISEQLMEQFVKRAEEIEIKINNNGGLMPVIAENVEELKKTTTESKTKKGEPIEDPWLDVEDELGDKPTIKAPIDESQQTGDLEVNKEKVGARQGLTPETPTRAPDKNVEAEATNKDLDIDQVPSAEDLDASIKDRLEYQAKLQALDDIDGGNRVEESLSLSRAVPRTDGSLSNGANAQKLDPTSPEGQALIKNELDILQKEDLNPALVSQAVRELGKYVGDGAEVLVRKMEFLKEATKAGSDFYVNAVPKIIVSMSLIRGSTATLLRSIRDMRQVNSGINIAMSKEVALKNFTTNYKIFRQNLAAIDAFYQAVGNSMRFFGPAGRLEFLPEIGSAIPGSGKVGITSWSDPKKIKVAVDNIAGEFKKLGDNEKFASALADEARKAQIDIDNEVADFMKKFDEDRLTDQDYNGIENLMEHLELAKGNMEKLKDVAFTSKELMATLHSGHVLSSWAFPASIPAMGQIGMTYRTAAKWGQHQFSGNFERVLLKFGLGGSAEEVARQFKQARHSRRWLMSARLFHLQGLEAAKNSFMFNKSISDPLQAKRADVGLDTNRLGSMTREEAIIQSRKGNIEHNTVWAKWLVKTFKDNPKMLNFINETVTFGKVFHDYAVPGEGWRVKGLQDDGTVGGGLNAIGTGLHRLADWPVGASQKLTGLFRGGEGIGSKSYFPQGERVNLSLFQQLASAGDEGITAQWTRAAIYADAIENVEVKINNDVLDASQKIPAIKAEFKRLMKEKSQGVPAGFDQQTVGNTILDERALELIRKVNQTEEITGPLGSIKNAVTTLRDDKNPAVRYTARFIWPIINSPLVNVKQAVKYAYGYETYVAMPISLTRAGGGYLTEKLMANRVISNFAEGKGKKWLQTNVIDFESKYFSKDPAIRDKARNAFALSAGIQALVATIVWDEDSEVTSGLDDTYKVAEGRAERFRWNVFGWSIPYRYIPLIGENIAFQSTMRDIIQFNPDYDGSGYFNVFQAAMASTIMDMPGLAGISKVQDAISKQKEGDGDAVLKLAQLAYTRIGTPYTEGKKSFRHMFLDDSKIASTTEMWKGPGAWKRGKLHEKGSDTDAPKSIAQEILAIPALAHENDLAFFTDHIWATFKGNKDFRLSTRKAVPFGKPEEVVKAQTGPWYAPWETILGRYWWGNNDLTDPVNRAIVNLMIEPPDNALYNSFQGKTVGIGINDRELNNFNHFFNTEYTFTVKGKEYVGINSYIRDKVKGKNFLKYDEVDSPFIASKKGDWVSGNTKEIERRMILKSDIDEQLNKAKIQYLHGVIPGQRFKASEELKTLVLDAYTGRSN